MQFVEFISQLHDSKQQTIVWHHQTTSYAEHKALNKYYDEIVDLIDELVESVSGVYGRPVGYSVERKKFTLSRCKKIAQKILDLAKPYQAKVLINENEKLALDIGADGVHYPSYSLIQLKHRPDFPICGASCHNLKELLIAQDLKMSFAVLSSVQKTESHAGLVS